MKICFVSTFYGNPLGGAEISVQLLAESLIRKEIDVIIITSVDKINDKNIRHVTLPKFLHRKFVILGNILIDEFLSKKIEKIVLEENPDIIHVHDLYMLPACVSVSKKLGVPIVVTIRDNVPKRLSEHSNFFLDMMLNYFLNKRNDTWLRNLHDVDKTIAISHFIKNELEKNRIYNICVIYNIAPLWIGDESVSKSIRDVVLFTPGRFHDEKGMDISIKALDIILKSEKDVKLVLLGDGPNKNKLKKLVDRLGLIDYVEFIDRVPFKDVKMFYQMSDIVIFSPSYQEPLGRVAIEAGASGKPIIASSVGGIPEIIIDGKTGFLVRSNDVDGVVNKVMTLMKNKSLYKEMGINARDHIIKKFDQNKIVFQHIDLYKKVIENGS